MSYVELHCHSAFSFLDGASHPEELALRAAELGYEALALTDHEGVYGSLEFASAAKHFGVRPITGAEVTLHGTVTPTSTLRLVELAAERRSREPARRVVAGVPNLCALTAHAHTGRRRAPSPCRPRSTRRCLRS